MLLNKVKTEKEIAMISISLIPLNPLKKEQANFSTIGEKYGC